MHCTYGPTRALACAALLCGVLLTSASAATPQRVSALSTAGSIAYLYSNNVWIARPDGSHAHAVTRDGSRANPYESPTQADNGTIEAMRNLTTLIHLDRNGRQLGPRIIVATGPSNNISLHTLAFDPAINPNGKFVASAIMEYQGLYDPATGAKGTDIIAEDLYFFNLSNGKRVGRIHLAGTDLMAPSWVTNYRLLVFAPYNICAPQVYVFMRNGKGWNWFADADCTSFNGQPLNHGQLTRRHDKLAVIRGPNLASQWRGTTIQLYSVPSFFDKLPKETCAIQAQHGAFGSLSWSPDGTTLAWSDSNGIWESPVNLASANCGIQPRLVIRNGSNPSWGPIGVAR